MSNNNNNQKVVPQAKQALNQMKLEIANELGMSNYQQMALKASKREANFKIRFPTVRVRPQEDYLVDRSKV